MRLLHPPTLLSDNRYQKRRTPPRFLVIGVLVLIGCVGLWVAIGTGDDDRSQKPESRIESLATPAWHESELNSPTLPGASKTKTLSTSVQETSDDPLHIIGRVKRNETLFITLRNRGIPPDRIHPVVGSMSGVFDFRRSRPGDKYEVRLDLDGNIVEFKYQRNQEDIYVSQLIGNQYVSEKVYIPKEIKLVRVEGRVATSLFASFAAVGETNEVARAFMDLFAFDFDFGTSSRQGDKFTLLAEKLYLDGEFYKYGKILAARYETPEVQLAAWYFDKNEDGDGKYYDTDGRSLERLFLKSAVPNGKLTSGFDRKRFHPILKRVRPHLGVDWAAPTGTPVLAMGDGTISFIGWKGGNGNFIVIDHDYGYQSVYAHLSRFSRGLKRGSVVKQKQVIAAVGSTGLSTGPHLHYGLKQDGKYIDPMSVDSSRGPQLTGRAMKGFTEEKERLAAMLDGKAPIEQPPAPTPPESAIAAAKAASKDMPTSSSPIASAPSDDDEKEDKEN